MKRNPHTDAACYAEMEKIIRAHVRAAMVECAKVAEDLTIADPMRVMAGLNERFGWYHLGDNFSDAVDEFRSDLCDLGLDFKTAYNKPRSQYLKAE